MAERLPPGAYDAESLRLACLPNGLDRDSGHHLETNGERNLKSDSINSSDVVSHVGLETGSVNEAGDPSELPKDLAGCNGISSGNSQDLLTPNEREDFSDHKLPNSNGGVQGESNSVLSGPDKESGHFHGAENGMKQRNLTVPANPNQVEAEWIEQYEPGVYITLVALQDGTRDLKRVRFRY